MRAAARWPALAWIAVVVAHGATAAAQPAPPVPAAATMAEARAHFEKGVALLKEKEWAGALAEFMRSRELYPKPSATTNAVICLRQLGRDDEALDLLEALLRASPDLPADKRAEIEREVADVRALVGVIAIEGGEARATIEIDGRLRGALPAPGSLYVKPGSHLVRALAGGSSPFQARVEVAAGQTVHLVIDERPPPAPPAPPPIALPPPPRALPPATPPAPPKGGSFAPGVIVLSAGGIGLVLGAATGVVSLNEASHVKSQCKDGVCPVSTLGEANASRMIGNVSTAAFVAGGLVAAAGVVLLVVRPGGARATAPARAVVWNTRVGLGHAELAGSF